jgi:hypothetical protein
MAKELTPIDISDTPDLLQLAEEVHRSGQPRLLRREDEDLAVLSPAPMPAKRRARKAKPYTKADDDAFLAAAGAWKDFDLEEFLKNNEESRRVSRPPVEL